MNRCSVCHELLPGLTQGMCSQCKDWAQAQASRLPNGWEKEQDRLRNLSFGDTPTPSLSMDWHQTVRQNRQQLHQQRLNRLSSFPLGQSSPPTIQESSSGGD
jgi:predicted amidophosphoribosyltransferase